MWYVVSKSRNANTVHFRGNEIIINNVNEGFIFKVVPGGKVARTRYGFVRWSLEAHEAHWRLVVYEVTDSGVRGGVETRTTGVQVNARISKTNPTLHSSASSGHWGALMKARLQNRRCNPAPPPSPKPDMPEKTRNWPG